MLNISSYEIRWQWIKYEKYRQKVKNYKTYEKQYLK